MDEENKKGDVKDASSDDDHMGKPEPDEPNRDKELKRSKAFQRIQKNISNYLSEPKHEKR